MAATSTVRQTNAPYIVRATKLTEPNVDYNPVQEPRPPHHPPRPPPPYTRTHKHTHARAHTRHEPLHQTARTVPLEAVEPIDAGPVGRERLLNKGRLREDEEACCRLGYVGR